jgi:NAD(P)-dependent dehydrogenase (short-subunit alcohol dehydrogenase family)
VSSIFGITVESVVQPRTFAANGIAHLHMLASMPSALVTGAGRGMGLEIARRLVGRGYEVAVTDVDEETTASAAEELGDRAWGLPLDVTDADACRAAASQVVERSGSLDVWVNNAGILITGLSYEQDIAVHRRMLEVNAVGTMNGTLAAIERMRPAGRGHIINLISLAGLAAATGIVGYSASKHAAIAFSLGTAADLRRNGMNEIHISCVCPDGVWTPMITDKLDDPNDALSFSGVMLMPEQVAEHVVGLLDKPKPVLTIPRWRGRFARFFDRHPQLSLRLTPLLMRDARRRQRAFKKKVEAGKWPPTSP